MVIMPLLSYKLPMFMLWRPFWGVMYGGGWLTNELPISSSVPGKKKLGS